MFMEALVIIAQKWKEPKCSSFDEWINIMEYLHTMGYYSAKKRNKVLIYAATRMNFENTVLS